MQGSFCTVQSATAHEASQDHPVYTPVSHEVSQQLDFSVASLIQLDFSVASPVAVSLNSAKANAMLCSINLETMSDPDSDDVAEAEDSGGSDTASAISWATSSDGFRTEVSDIHLP
uniref:Uncharacterized protein n=1 Tax=Eutreptiella gymnastica TaxID=73025 RepID=A0A7S4FST7_9EUGL